MREIILLAVLDGWGIGKKDEGNPLYMAKKNALSFIEANFPCGALQASGIAVGLPWEAAGTSEVGHLTLGAGRTVYQNYPRVSLAIRDGSFMKNPALASFMEGAKKGTLHFVGLLSEASSYASKEHLYALISLAEKAGIKGVMAHLIADNDGPGAGKEFLKSAEEFEAKLSKVGGRVATVSGSYYGMSEPEKVAEVYRTLMGSKEAPRFKDLQEFVAAAEKKNPSLKLAFPDSIEGGKPVSPGDSVLFFNFEPGGIETLAAAFSEPDFRAFDRGGTPAVSALTLTDYGVGAQIAFPKEEVVTPLGKALSDAGKSQMRIAESEKEKSVAFYFNGGREAPFPNEYRAIVPSKKTLSPEEHPEMMAETITERALMTLQERGFDFVMVNYANADAMARTGSYEATKRAAEIIDAEIGKLLSAVLQENHTLIIVGSHGNAETLLNEKTGEADKENNPDPVPFYLVKASLKKVSVPRERLPHIGLLSDVAPTILALMGLLKPPEMTGESLLSEL